jgi:uroporphyrinogen decarboxylase
MREPDFENILKVLRCQTPSRPTLFEFFLNDTLYRNLAGPEVSNMTDKLAHFRLLIHAFRNAEYDYATVHGSSFGFQSGQRHRANTISLNEGNVICGRRSFEDYPWPNPDLYDYSILNDIKDELIDGMKLIVCGPGGVLENVISLTGYDNLCFIIYDDPKLAADIFDAVGSRLLRYYEICGGFDTVGALISNDDWGFKTQPMLTPQQLRQYVFPWHKKIVNAIHSAGKPAILHSCGNFDNIMEDVICDLRYDGKHSYEDNILPVEEAYERFGSRIAILGGIDLDFVCRSKPEQVRKRSFEMLKRSEKRGGYALGTGNSVPEFVPAENYFAMISAALNN